MTDLDKQAAARLVAEKIGYKVHSDDEGFFFCQYPDGEYSDSVFPSEEEAIAEAFPLFDRTAGALALLEAEEWLLNTRKFDYSNVTRYAKGLSCAFGVEFEDSNGVCSPEGLGATLAEARALAICNAVRGMREDKNAEVYAP